MNMSNVGQMQNFNPLQQEAFMVPAGTANRNMYPHSHLSSGGRPSEHKAAAEDLVQNFESFDLTGRSDLSQQMSMGQTEFFNQALVDVSVGLAANQNKFSSHNGAPTTQFDQTVIRNDEPQQTYHNASEDRPINATGQYDLSVIPLDEIEVYDNYSELEMASLDNTVLDSVMREY